MAWRLLEHDVEGAFWRFVIAAMSDLLDGDLARWLNQRSVLRARMDPIAGDKGKRMITWRFAKVEPVIGNTRNNKRLERFTLRGQKRGDGQWKLYCLVHNIEKLAHHGYAG